MSQTENQKPGHQEQPHIPFAERKPNDAENLELLGKEVPGKHDGADVTNRGSSTNVTQVDTSASRLNKESDVKNTKFEGLVNKDEKSGKSTGVDKDMRGASESSGSFERGDQSKIPDGGLTR